MVRGKEDETKVSENSLLKGMVAQEGIVFLDGDRSATVSMARLYERSM